MKKIVLFIIAVIAINSMNLKDVNAEVTNFYEAEYISNIYMRKKLNSSGLYQKARFFRQRSNGNPAYCIEPFKKFTDGAGYNETAWVDGLSENQLQKMQLLSHYGYLYPGHEDTKWYAITQLLIWETALPNATFEFTNGLNGETIYPYQNEINELKQLVNNHLVMPSFSGEKIELVEEEEKSILDTNNVLTYYETTSPNAKIEGNNLIIKNLKEGTHTINIVRKAKSHENPALFYYKGEDQKLITLGNAQDISGSITVTVKKTELEITKVDKDTNSTNPSGDAKLIGAKYGLYDKNNNLIKELIIEKDNKASIENLPYGSYTLKELEAGLGYQLDNNIYKVEINSENTSIKLTLANEVIKKKLQINKEFGTDKEKKKEANITFDIYNSKDEYITSITTDEKGHAEITLPYGTYIVKQKNTTENYKPVEDFKVEINETTEDQTYNLFDYKIEVPETRKNIPYLLYSIIIVFLGGFYVYQKQML